MMFGERPTLYRVTLGVGAVLAAIVSAAGVWAQIAGLVSQGTFVWQEYFSYFTIMTVIGNSVVLLFAGVHSFSFERDGALLSTIRHVLVTYALVAAAVYHLLLRDLTDPNDPYVAADSIPMQIFHTWLPLYLVIDWVINPFRTPTRWSHVWWVAPFPVTWLTFTLFRGAETDWYPYPFVNPGNTGGYEAVFLTSSIVAGVLFALHLALVTVDRITHRPPEPVRGRGARR